MLLSLIIPFYWVERYLPACLAALEELPEAETEILLVDDCGGDGCLAIAEAWCQGRNNARVLRRTANGGLSAARNTGLDAAQGDYVFFLDSDDIPIAEHILAVARQAKAQALDVAKGRFLYFDDESGAQWEGPRLPGTDVMTGEALFVAESRTNLFEPMVWQCLYRRDFLMQIGLRMAEGLLFEDELFQAPALLRAERVRAFECPLLRYRQRAGSIMGGFARDARWCACYLTICERLSALLPACGEEAERMLRRRVGQIALNVPRNIVAYGLSGTVRAEALAFLRTHRSELAAYAKAAGGTLALQGTLLATSPAAYMRLYAIACKMRRRGG